MKFAWLIVDPTGRLVDKTNHRSAVHAKQHFLHMVNPMQFPPPQIGVDTLAGHQVYNAWRFFEEKGFQAKRFVLEEAIRKDVIETGEEHGEDTGCAAGAEDGTGAGDQSSGD